MVEHHVQRIEAVEQKLSHDFIQNLIRLQIDQAIGDKLKDWEQGAILKQELDQELKKFKV